MSLGHTVTVTGDEQRQIYDRLAPHLPPYLRKIEPNPYGWGLRFQFAPFTGREQEPAMPAAVYEDPRLTYVAQSQDASEHRLRRVAKTILSDLYDQARDEWKDAAYVADLREAVQDAPERWRVYEREAQAMQTAYAYLRTPEAGREWLAAISRLVDAQDRTRAAAVAFDERAREIAFVHDRHLYADLGPVQALIEAGYPEAADWHVGDGFEGYFRNGLTTRVDGLIQEQEAHLTRVGRLAGQPT
ncbi:hypothetical protein ABZ387_31825 [Streptomyces flaveolus]|uniref:hypothetical protein n=1 Tax=Streptomyces flaveolus TaxID=67297 RepID=UPI0033F661EF